MKKLNKPAILVVDMLNDFVYGALTCDRGKAIVPATAQLLDAARVANVPVIFCNDAHRKGIDRELVIWGDHAIADTPGAEVIPELKVSDSDYIVPKRRYSGFFQTDLDILLKELGVPKVGFVINKLNMDMIRKGFAPEVSELTRGFHRDLLGVIQTDENIHVSTNLGVPIVFMQDTYIAENFRNISSRICAAVGGE